VAIHIFALVVVRVGDILSVEAAVAGQGKSS
jgi:acyl-CoA hydrolase